MTILRFHTPLIEPDRRIFRIRLSDKACVLAIFPLRRQRRLVHGGAGRVSGVSQPVSGVHRLAPISRLSSPSALGLELRPLPSTGVTRRPRYYEPLRHPGGNPACGVGPGLSLTGVRLRVTRPHRLGFPVLRWISMYRHAVVITPVARWVLIARGTAYSTRFPFIPSDGGLPHASARSATTLDVSRPAQRLLALRPVGSLHRQGDISVSKAPTVSLPPHELFSWEYAMKRKPPPYPRHRSWMPEELFPRRCA